MCTTLLKLLKSCWLPLSSRQVGSDGAGRQDGLLWYKDTGQHVNGEFSMAVMQANNLLEDQCQVESGALSFMDAGPCGTFVGVYDGHGGPETACYINDHLFNNLKSEFFVICYRKMFHLVQADFGKFILLFVTKIFYVYWLYI
jgi:pyruvate dehydrogenase phosphatase